MKNITVFTKDGCVSCKMTKETLKQLGIEFTERNINHDETAIQELISQGFQTVPLVMVDGVPKIAVFRPDKLKELTA
ncbi:MAG: glutaredoxin family protein [Lactobacillaceae bacterium]|jgi:glutaredoxin-like protein NrdH|nr:glutaredoxin family protein [Lactobacillaceae bacterium]